MMCLWLAHSRFVPEHELFGRWFDFTSDMPCQVVRWAQAAFMSSQVCTSPLYLVHRVDSTEVLGFLPQSRRCLEPNIWLKTMLGRRCCTHR